MVTTCFNRAGSIGRCMESVLAQDYQDIEYIVIDGMSTDGTLDIINKQRLRAESEDFIREHPSFTMRVVSEPDGGMYEALNKGIRMATGDIIAMLHSDDAYYDDSTLTAVASAFDATGCDLLYADGLYVSPTRRGRVVRDWRGSSFSLWKVRHGWLPLHTTCYVTAAAVGRLGLYDEQYKIAADTDFLLRYLTDGTLRVHYLRRYVVRMLMGGMSTSADKRRRMWNEDVSIYARHGFKHPVIAKIEKMAWKVPQFVRGLFMR